MVLETLHLSRKLVTFHSYLYPGMASAVKYNNKRLQAQARYKTMQKVFIHNLKRFENLNMFQNYTHFVQFYGMLIPHMQFTFLHEQNYLGTEVEFLFINCSFISFLVCSHYIKAAPVIVSWIKH